MHFGVIYLGYLGSLWLWRRRERMRAEASESDPSQLAAYAGAALAVGGGIALVGGALSPQRVRQRCSARAVGPCSAGGAAGGDAGLVNSQPRERKPK